MTSQFPVVICATGYPLHADAIRTYLRGFYGVDIVQHHNWQDGIARIQHLANTQRVVALIVDDTFPRDAIQLARWMQEHHPHIGLIYIAHELNIFRVLRALEVGFLGYLYLGDTLAERLKQVIDHTRRGERFLSQTVMQLYDRYVCYRGLFTTLPKALASTFKMMGEGLSIQEIVERTGLRAEIIYRRQYRLRQHFGVETNQELVDLIQQMYAQSEIANTGH